MTTGFPVFRCRCGEVERYRFGHRMWRLGNARPMGPHPVIRTFTGWKAKRAWPDGAERGPICGCVKGGSSCRGRAVSSAVILGVSHSSGPSATTDSELARSNGSAFQLAHLEVGSAQRSARMLTAQQQMPVRQDSRVSCGWQFDSSPVAFGSPSGHTGADHARGAVETVESHRGRDSLK